MNSRLLKLSYSMPSKETDADSKQNFIQNEAFPTLPTAHCALKMLASRVEGT